MSHLVPLSMAEAIYSLYQCQFTLDATESLDYLETQLNIYSLLALYQQYFPTEWKASQAPIYPPTDVDCHSPRELEFIVLIYTHLFPLSHWTTIRKSQKYRNDVRQQLLKLHKRCRRATYPVSDLVPIGNQKSVAMLVQEILDEPIA
jgi:hypothetical protein